ncbi:response regulator transcription factor [Motilimonas cestriensis]|uniref:Response regulator transcription factor n=1 Tax=Motilimonas cestriensis TaxID=2742685 RepID=A0ABS8WC21_9GAMM|nr:response regulator transcription factor [Motilimonas cestriensis]MCE2595815.1 response regulator transcription factor [Motilimonas cestriensis]
MRVLIVEDNADISANIGDFLAMLGHRVDFAYHGKAALTLLAQERFDAMVLDVMMPVMDGINACQQIRQSEYASMPIIFVTARDTLADKLAGFDAGGDDYLVKPFALPELAARLESIVQRKQGLRAPKITVAGLSYDKLNQQVSYLDQPLNLDPVQVKLVKTLLSHAPAIVSKHDLSYALWQDEDVEGSALRTHIYRLRKTLPVGLLETVRGKGYRIHAAT